MDLSGSLYDLMGDGFGLRPVRAVEKLELVEARPSDARSLGIRRDAPLLLVERIALRGRRDARRVRARPVPRRPHPARARIGPALRMIEAEREVDRPRRRHRRRRRRVLHPLLAHPARLGRRRPRRALRPDERLDVPLGRARRPAAELAGADADDDELGRALPHARGGGGARDRLARGRVAAPRLLARAAGGDHAPGGLGEDVRPPARARLGGRGAGALPADVDGRRARSRLSPERRLHRPEPAHVRARRGRAASWRRGQHQHAGDGHHDRARRGDRAS